MENNGKQYFPNIRKTIESISIKKIENSRGPISQRTVRVPVLSTRYHLTVANLFEPTSNYSSIFILSFL